MVKIIPLFLFPHPNKKKEQQPYAIAPFLLKPET